MTTEHTNRTKVTKSPIDTILETAMCPAEMLMWLTAGAIELYALGAEPGDTGPEIFINAMRPVALTGYLEDGELEEAQAKVAAQREASLKHKEGEEYPLMIAESWLFRDIQGPEIVSVIGTLIETMVWVPDQADRKAVAYLIYYLKDYWVIGECLRS